MTRAKMKYSGGIKVAAIYVALINSFALGMEMDFNTETPLVHLCKDVEKYGQQVEYRVHHDNRRQALHLRWDESKSPFIQVALPKQDKLNMPGSGRVRCVVNVTTAGACPARFFYLRLADASGEIFQFRAGVFWSKAGSWDIGYDIDLSNPGAASIFGGDNNKTLNLPARLYGFSVGFAKKSGLGELFVNSIRFEQVKQTDISFISANLAEPLLDPAAKPDLIATNAIIEFVNISGAEDCAVKIKWEKGEPKNLRVTYCKIGPLGAIATAPRIPDLSAAEVTVEATTAGAVDLKNIKVIIADQGGELFWFSKPVNWDCAGRWRVAFDINPNNPAFEKVTGAYVKTVNKKLDSALRFVGIAADYAKGSSGEFLVNRITLKAKLRLVDALRFDVDTGHPLHIIEPGKERELKFRLKNLADCPLIVRASFSMRDFNEKTTPCAMGGELSFAPGESKSFAAAKPEALGVWKVDCDIAAPKNNNDIKRLTRSFACMHPVGATPEKGIAGFAFGINSHPERTPSQIALEAEAISLVGAKVLRNVIGLPEDYGVFDKIADEFGKKGVTFDWIIGGHRSKPDFAKWQESFRKTFTRYKGRVRYWELMNEPDLGEEQDPTPEDYLKMARTAREELSRIDPQAMLVSAGFCNFGTLKRGNFHEEVMTQANGVFDLHCFHGHSDFRAYCKVIDELLLPMRKRAKVNVPWYSNETALSRMGFTEKVQAQALFKKLLFAWSRGAVGYNWYNLRDKGEDPFNTEHNYGMLTMDFYPRDVYAAFNTLVQLYGGKRFVRQLPLGEDLWAFEFRSENDAMFGAWSENFSQNYLLLKSDARSAELVDLMGNITPLGKQDGVWVMPLSAEVHSLHLSEANNAEVCAPLLAAEDVAVLTPGQAVPLNLTLHNPFDSTCNLEFNLNLPEGITTDKNAGAIKLNPGELARWDTRLCMAETFAANRYGSTVTVLGITCRWGKDNVFDLSMPLKTAILLNTGIDGEPAFTLESRDNVVSLVEADPANLDKVWTSPNDLSAKIWAEAKGEKLLFKIDVRDDKHVEPYCNADCWKGDSVQMFMRLPGQQQLWEFDFYRTDSGASGAFVRLSPSGFDKSKTEKVVKITTSRNGEITHYQAEIPIHEIGLEPAKLGEGIRFNLMVNDNDSTIREGWIRIAPGIGGGNLSLQEKCYPLLIIRQQ